MKRWLTPWHLNFFLGVFLALQAGLFLYLESTGGVTDRQDRIRGRDFLHFYLAGRLVAEGRAELLYDQDSFLALQKSISPVGDKNPPYVSVYPPHSALLFSPLGHLSYPRAVECWWFIQLLCVLLSAWLLLRQLQPSAEWRITAWLGLLAFYPVLNTFWNGQIAALLLLILVVALKLHRQQRYFAAGLLLSLISLKPQLALGWYLWLLLRSDWRTLAGVALGGLIQLSLVLGLLGPDSLLQYVHNSKLASTWYAFYTMSPDHQHALAGILTTLFGNSFNSWSMIIQAAVALLSGWLLWRIIRSTPEQRACCEIPAAVLFTLLCTPHLLTYDLSYLLIAVVGLLCCLNHHPPLLIPILLIYSSAMLAPLYVVTQMSLVPIALLASLLFLVKKSPHDTGLFPQLPG